MAHGSEPTLGDLIAGKEPFITLVSLSWKQGQDHFDFLESSKQTCKPSPGLFARNQPHVDLVLDDIFITSFCALNDDASRHVLESLTKLPIVEVSYGAEREPLPEQLVPGLFASRFDQLCQTLATWPDLNTATTKAVGTEAGKILKTMTQLSHLKCLINETAALEDVQQMLTSLGSHSSIQSLVLTADTKVYPMVLPVLQSLPRLKSVRLVNCRTQIYDIVDTGWGRSVSLDENRLLLHH